MGMKRKDGTWFEKLCAQGWDSAPERKSCPTWDRPQVPCPSTAKNQTTMLKMAHAFHIEKFTGK